ncbi:MAG: RraA family protein, partial [Clostridia bacterium]|nr:RraA family protein [Clostridia bacterium]
IDPTPIRDFVMTGFNTPTRFGGAIVLPGDIVFGAGGGVLFIPSHLVAEVVDGASKTQVKDIFGFEMITQNKFTTAQIDRNTWTVEMLDMLTDFIRTDDRGIPYRELDWSEEYDLAVNGDPNDTQTSL